MTDLFFRACAGAMLAVILILSLRGQGREIGLLVSIFVCCGIGIVAVSFLRPVTELIRKLQNISSLDSEMMGIMLKVVGIALIGELSGLVCADAGNSAMGKGLQFLSVTVILWLSIPMFTKLMDLIERMMGNL